MEPVEDKRGFFARTWCKQEFEKYGLNSNIVQCNLSFNKKKGTIRGMHYQITPYMEVKMVSCLQGRIYDVIIDLRPESKTFKQWTSIVIDEKNRTMLYVPPGFAHGFQTLEDDTEVFYQMSEYYQPDFAFGIRYDDPAFQIKWPYTEGIVISEKDKAYKDFPL